MKIKKSNYETASKSRNENTDLNDNEQPKTEVNIYPNPAANLLNVSYNLDQKNPYTLYVYDIVGKQLSSHPLNRDNNVIDLTGLPHGIYVIKVKGKHEEIVKRLEIQ